MRALLSFVLLLAFSALPLACESSLAGAPNSPAAKAASWMTGSFTSAAQAQRDPDFMVINLHMSPMWTDRTDGFWFYVEQATAATPEKPYRQRVYRVWNLDDGLVQSDVYELPGDPLRFAGAWQNPALLADLRPDQLVAREGCSITLREKTTTFDGGKAVQFEGGTEGAGCESSLRGASFATSEVILTEGEMRTWDRGWKASGEQAWGSVNGPYVFVRIPKQAAPSRPG